ncbi:MAG: hypothetical protein KAW88_06070, partial [Candidatus Cloacimonetes bacterium]|nr:hypothetical protein [Candidatus Cloacimonadota bacterium]
MKSKKWLLIIVLIVFVINITFFVLVRLAKVDEIVQKKFSSYISKTLQADVKIESFNFNDKQLKVIGLQIKKADSFKLEIKQLYVEYNLLKLVFSNFKNLRSIKHIKVYEPNFEYKVVPKPRKKKKEKSKIPDITRYFKALDIYNGNVTIEYTTDKIEFKNTWEDINISIVNTSQSDINLNAKSGDISILEANLILSKGNIESASFKIMDFFPEELKLPVIKQISSNLDFYLVYKDKTLSYTADLKNTRINIFGKNAKGKNINLSGNDKSAEVKFNNFFFDGNRIQGNVKLNEVFTKSRQVKADFRINNVPLSKYLKSLNGNLSIVLNISGKVSELEINAEIVSEEIVIAKQKLSDINLTAEFKNKTIFLKLKNLIWEENLLQGDGKYNIGKDFSFNLYSDNLCWKSNTLEIKGKLDSDILYDKKLFASVILSDIIAQNPKFKIQDLLLKADLKGNDFTIDFGREKEDVTLFCTGNIKTKEISTKLKFKRFDLNSAFQGKTLPLISGNLDIEANKFSIVASSTIRVYDRDFGKLDGRIKTNVVLDLTNKKSFFNLRSHNAKFNYEPFEINLLAEGTLDSIQTKQFKINKNIDINTWVRLKPSFNFGMTLSGEKIKIRDFAKYFMSYDASSKLKGNVNFNIDYDNRKDGALSGEILVDDFRFGEMKELALQLNLNGNNNFIKIDDSHISSRKEKILDINSQIFLKPELSIIAIGKIDTLELQDIFSTASLQGNVTGRFFYSKQKKENEFKIDMYVENFKSRNFKANSIELHAVQKDSVLSINNFSLIKANDLKLIVKGAIGYNLLNSNAYADTNTIDITFEGDVFKLLANQTRAIVSGESKCNLNMKFGMGENGLSINEGNFSLTKGNLTVKDQLEKINKFTIKFDILDNILNMEKFKFRLGEGKFYLKNEVGNNDNDFRLGMLNLGKFLIYTNKDGILFHMPKFTPGNSVMKLVIKGRDSDYLEVTGPFDDMKIFGDIYVSNGQVIYPPDTENLLKLFNKVTKEKKKTSEAPLPFTLDIMLHFGDNIRYVTYPVDVTITPGGYIHLKYENGQFILPEALFISEKGSVDMFGTKLLLDYLQIQLSQYDIGAKISGTFYKKTSDGTLITLVIYNEESTAGTVGTLRFELRSDNPADKITDIFAKLRYNRTMDEISPAQKKSLLQDEVIQIAGLGLESAVLDPLISPVENWVRQLFRLDYFHLQTDLIQNLFASYSSENKSEYYFTEESNEVAR